MQLFSPDSQKIHKTLLTLQFVAKIVLGKEA